MPAVLGPNTRLNNFRLAYLPAAVVPIRETRVRIWIDGEPATARVRLYSLQIRDLLNDAPNTCTLVIEGEPPPVTGMALRITINSDTPRLLFAGTIQVEGETFDGTPAHVSYPCSGVDDTGRINKRRPIGTWTSVSATTVVQELVTAFAPGFTADHVEAGLPLVSVIYDGTEGFTGALRQIAKLVGGYFYVEDRDVHLFLTESLEAPGPVEDGTFLHDPKIQASADDSQLRTRVYGRGHAEATTAAVAAGDTVIPIANAVMFNALGGQAYTDTQILTYTGTALGDTGALIGPGVTPTSAPTAAGTSGSGLTAGPHTFAYVWKTAAGRTLPSPVSGTVTAETVAVPGAVSSVNHNPPFTPGPVAGTVCRYVLTISLDAARTAETTIGTATAITSAGYYLSVFWQISAAMVGRYSNVYRNDNGGTYYLIRQQGPHTAAQVGQLSGYTDANVTAAGSGGGNPPVSNTAIVGRANLTGIAVGPSGVTDREIYMTPIGGTPLKLATTIANNTATTATISTADGSLGATVPSTDTSGLTQPVGQVTPGATTIPVSSTGFASAAGGWARIDGDQIVRYTGISGATLTGVPSSGNGAIVAAVAYNSVITAAPALTGVTGLTRALIHGTPVHIWVQRNALDAQAAAAARETSADYTSDGIHEEVIVDERRGEASLIAACDAQLALFAYPLVTVTYATRDVRTKSGKPVTIDLASPLIDETLTIQDVTIDQIDSVPGLAPRFTVTASSVRFSLEDTLRRLSGLVVEG